MSAGRGVGRSPELPGPAGLALSVVWLVLTCTYTAGLLLIATVMVPTWRFLSGEEFLSWSEALGSRVGALMAPLMVLSLLTGIAVLALTWRRTRPLARVLPVVGVLALLAQAGLLLGYFLPTDLAFAAHEIAAQDVARELDTWVALHTLRTALAAIAGLAAAAFLVLSALRVGKHADVPDSV